MSGQESMPGWATAAFRLVAAIAAAGLVIMLVQFGVGKLAAAVPIAGHIALVEAAMTIVLFGLLAAVALIALRIAHEPLTPGKPIGLGIGMAAGITGLAAALVLASLAGVVGSGAGATGFGGMILLGTILTLWQTGVEEVYFRGWLQPALVRGWGRWPGLAGSALAFAALHLLAGATGISLLTITLAGLWFGLLAERSGGLALPIGAHFGWNWAEEIVFGAGPNPGIGSYGALFDLDLAGGIWWSGGEEGLNASLAAIFVLLALIALTFAWPAARLKGAPAQA